MQKNIELDWFVKLKMEVVKLRINFNEFKKNIVALLLTSPWILEDANLFESYVRLQEMVEISEVDLDSLTKELEYLEMQPVTFAIDDVMREFNFVRENIDLEMAYLFNMSLYMLLVDNYSLSALEIEERCNIYAEIDTWCHDQMEINNEQLKILKKERRDYFE